MAVAVPGYASRLGQAGEREFSAGNLAATSHGKMRSYQASLWRDLAKEAVAAADRTLRPEVQRQLISMAAHYLAMAERVEAWTLADEEKTE